MKTLFIHLKMLSQFYFTRFLKAAAFTSMIFLFFSTTPASTAPSCRPYFIQNDVLQKFDSTEYASLLTSAEMLGRLLGKTDSVSQNAKEALDKQVWDLIASKRFTAEQQKLFLAFFLKRIQEHQPTVFLHKQEAIKASLLKEQQDYFRQMKLIVSKYQTDDINTAFVRSSQNSKNSDGTLYVTDMQTLLAYGADINGNSRDQNGNLDRTALISAAENNRLDLMEFLLNAKADIEATDKDGWTALAFACLHAHTLDSVDFLIQKGANINAKSNQGITPLMQTIVQNNQTVLDYLIKIGANLDIQNNRGETALMIALNQTNYKAAQKLMDTGANLDIRNNQGETALIIAIRNNRNFTFHETVRGVVARLLALKANVDAIDASGKTALMHAIEEKNSVITRLLIDAKANLDIQDQNGNTALLLAVEANQTDLATLLIQAGAKTHFENKQNFSAITIAIHKKNADLVKLLTNSKNIDSFISFGKTALMTAMRQNNLQLVQILIEAKANIDLKSKHVYQETVLMTYARQHTQHDTPDLALLKFLLTAKPNPYIQDQYGQTALTLATHPEVIKLLKEYERSLTWSESLQAKMQAKMLSIREAVAKLRR